MIPTNIFRAYDIRGIYGKDIDENVAYIVARAFARYVGSKGKSLVGRDVRLSGEALARAVYAGLEDEGMEVYYAGMVPTPALYLAVLEGRYDCGVQVTASHNPPEWNGFKLVLGSGETVSEETGMREVKRIATSLSDLRYEPVEREARKVNVLNAYVEKLLRLVSLRRRVRVAVDFSNGAMAVVGKVALEKAGCEVISLNDVPDGRFPAHLPEPNEETMRGLSALVKEAGAEFGIGFDGDGDRAVFLDEDGRVIDGDLALAIYVLHLGVKGRVVYDLSSSSIVEEAIKVVGCESVVSRVGRAFMLKKVRDVGAVIGGEKSNHFYFSELHGFDDGLYAALKMAEIVSKSSKPFSRLLESLPKYYSSPIYTVEVADEKKFEVVRSIIAKLEPISRRLLDIDGVKAYFDDGWILIRPSNTMPQIKYVAEAKEEGRLKEYLSLARRLIAEAMA